MYKGQVIRKNNPTYWKGENSNYVVIVSFDSKGFSYRYFKQKNAVVSVRHHIASGWKISEFNQYFEEV